MAAADANWCRPPVKRVIIGTAPLDEAGRLASEVYHPRVTGDPSVVGRERGTRDRWDRSVY